MTDDELTRLVPTASPSGTRRGWRCPDEEVLAAWVDGHLSGAQREQMEEHLADCSFCCGQIGFLARAVELGTPAAVPGHLLAQAQGKRSWSLWHLRPATIATAGAALLLALLVVTPTGRQWLPSSLDVTHPVIEAPGVPDVDRQVRTNRGESGSPSILRPHEGESVPLAKLEVQWEEAPEALFYTVEIVDPKGDVVWEGRAENARLAVPAAAPLAPGQSYFAWVVAHLRSGATVRSPAVGFRLAPG